MLIGEGIATKDSKNGLCWVLRAQKISLKLPSIVETEITASIVPSALSIA